MTITAKNIGRINVWPTYRIAREADTEESKFVGQLTVWQTNDEAIANISHEEEGGGGEPDWVPENAVIHVDLVGGDPQGRAWVAGTGEVAVDTLLGADANTANGWNESFAFDADNLTVDGYVSPDNPAFIGGARTKALAGATLVVRMKQVGETGPTTAFIITSEDGNDLVELDQGWTTETMDCSSYNGPLDEEYLNIIGTGEGTTNVFALTLTNTRWEAAANGTFCFAGVLDETDRPASNPMVAAMLDTGPLVAVQSITLYDPLPSTAGLSELSEVA